LKQSGGIGLLRVVLGLTVGSRDERSSGTLLKTIEDPLNKLAEALEHVGCTTSGRESGDDEKKEGQ
jgi:hypothetical protein